MDTKDIRLKCLELARNPAMNLDTVLATAERYFNFVAQEPITDAKKAAPVSTEEIKKPSGKKQGASGNSDVFA